MSLAKDFQSLDRLISQLSPGRRDDIRAGISAVVTALQGLKISGDPKPGDPDPEEFMEAIMNVAVGCVLCWRPGKGFSRVEGKVIDAVAQCPALSSVGGDLKRLSAGK